MSNYPLMPFRRVRADVGILGGSFNPPHVGHYYVCRQSMKRLNLKRVYCLVSPQNPLKSSDMYSTLNARFGATKDMLAKNTHHMGAIRASAIESSFKTNYTSNTLRRLRQMHPETRFIWLMGADNLKQMHRWYRWRDIIKHHHICVVDRTTDDHKISSNRISYLYPKKVVTNTVPKKKHVSWSFLKIRKIHISSTMIRAQKK